MNSERWQLINNLFQQAVDLEPPSRAAFLDLHCSSDEVLRREVESLLESDEHGWPLIEKPAFEAAAAVLVVDHALLDPGQEIGHYRIVSSIGQGGMGEVYLAEDRKLKRRIALKLLPGDYTKDKDRLQRFQREAHAASALNHPNILTIHERGEVDGRQFIATEFVEGETLRERLRSAHLSLQETIDIAMQAASALAAAHAAGIVHRDIKPENIMLRPDGYVKVLDFGLAKLTEQVEVTPDSSMPDSPDISSGLMMGTVAYMSPEQARGFSVDPRSDIFSLGVVLYELLTSHAPFKGESTAALIKAILRDTPPPLETYSVGMPEKVQTIIDKTLHKDRTQRYQTATDLLVDLKAVSQQPEFALRPEASTSASERQGHSTVSGKRTMPSIASVASQIRQHRVGATFGALTFIVVIIGALTPVRKLLNNRPASFATMPTATVVSNLKVAANAAISPDARFIAYSVEEAGRSSLWMSPVDGRAMPRQVTQPDEAKLTNLVFSRDGNSIYFNQEDKDGSSLYRISQGAGNSVVLVLKNQIGRVALSPDEKQLAFYASNDSEGESFLMVANVDGTNLRRLGTRKAPDGFFPANGPAWSPDGKMIVAIVEGGSVTVSSIIGFEVAEGTERRFNTLAEWPRFRDVAWLPDGSGLVLIVTSGGGATATQIWRLSYPGMEATRLTEREAFYESISIARTSDSLLAVERRTPSDIWTVPLDGSREATRLTETELSGKSGLCWTPDGGIIFHSQNQGIDSLWRMNPDGSNRRNLTPDSEGNFWPSVPADGRFVVFMSRRTGTLHIWRADITSGEQVQLTSGGDEQFPQVTADGKRVYYVSWDAKVGNVWQVSTDGGQPSQVVGESSYYPELSPDGRLLVYAVPGANRRKVVREGSVDVTHTFEGPVGRMWVTHWSRNGDALLYLDQRQGAWNVWKQPLDGGPPEQLTYFNEGRIYFFDESWDGKTLAVSRGSESRNIVLFGSD